MPEDDVLTAIDKKIRIAFVIDALYFPSGGTETQLMHLLSGLDRDRFEPELFCLRGTDWLGAEYTQTPVTVLDASVTRGPATLVAIWKLSRSFRANKFDIVQTHFRDSNIVGVLAASIAGGVKVVSTRRGVPYWSGRMGLVGQKLLNRRVTRFMANSQATGDLLVESEKVDPKHVEVIYNGLDPSRFSAFTSADRVAVRNHLGLASDASVVGIVANLRRVKGIDIFLEAAALVCASEPPAQFIVIGTGTEAEALHAYARELGIEDRVHFLGARTDIPELLWTMDVGVLASHFESFSNSILEYLASGLPVVATDVGGAREAVRQDIDGKLVPPGDPQSMAEAILVLLRAPAGARGWRGDSPVRSDFLVGHMVRAHEEFYARLAKD